MIVPQYTGKAMQCDRRGFITCSRQFVVDTEEEEMAAGLDLRPYGCVFAGSGSVVYRNHPTKRLVTVNYEGMSSNGTFNSEDAGTFELDVVLEENPIEAHPRIQELITEYGGEIDPKSKRVSFPVVMPTGQQSGGALRGKKNTAAPTRNPLYGLTSYVTLGSIFRRSYLSTSIPGDLLTRVGKLRDSLPNGFPTPDGMSWVVLPPRAVLRGNCYEIFEELKLVRSDDEGFKIVMSKLHE